MGKLLQFPSPKPNNAEKAFDKVVDIFAGKELLCPDCMGPAEDPHQVFITQGSRKWYQECDNEFHYDGPQVA